MSNRKEEKSTLVRIKEGKSRRRKAVKLSLVERKKSDRSGSSDENALRGASDVIFAAEGRWRGSVFSIRE
ncbi:hypothetical protein Q7C36_022378 [Tachysurus vachellii]|uniref:Uncharacterized protein n=1 Tax=Tachysurus vachellii TaxID=175792 RepID=A0AA88LNT8_TACVA|nr:hypothetical protein Q7C36_022378 [Tachysurus vachellii]